MGQELTTAQAAERLEAAERTVRLWCKQGLFPNARTQETPFGSYWLISEKDVANFVKPTAGRPRTKTAKKASKKK